MVLRVHRLEQKNTKHHSETDQSRVRFNVHGGRQRNEVRPSLEMARFRGGGKRVKKMRLYKCFKKQKKKKKMQVTNHILFCVGITRPKRNFYAIRKKAFWNWNKSYRFPGTPLTRLQNTK